MGGDPIPIPSEAVRGYISNMYKLGQHWVGTGRSSAEVDTVATNSFFFLNHKQRNDPLQSEPLNSNWVEENNVLSHMVPGTGTFLNLNQRP